MHKISRNSIIKITAAIGGFIGAMVAIVILYFLFKPTTIVLNSDKKVVDTIKKINEFEKVKNPEKIGHSFFGWYKDKELTQPFNQKSVRRFSGKKIQLYAKWIPNSIIISLDNENGDKLVTFSHVYGEGLRSVQPPQKTGFEFDGYFQKKDGLGIKIFDSKGLPISESNDKVKQAQISSLIGEKDITFYAYYTKTKKQYKVKFLSFDKTILSDQLVIEGESALAPLNTNRLGYKFKQWDTNYANVTDDLVINPIYEFKDYQVTLDAQGGVYSNNKTIKTKTVVYKSEFGLLDTPTKLGFNFVGYFSSFDASARKIKSTDIYNDVNDIILYARYLPKEYTITFTTTYPNAQIPIKTLRAMYNTTLPEIQKPILNGYEFSGYVYNDKTYYFSDLSTAGNYDIADDIELTATFRPINYIISYDPKGLNVIISKEAVRNYTVLIEAPLTPASRNGYKFVGWNIKGSSEIIDKISKNTTGNLTLEANWQLLDYNIIYSLDGNELNQATLTSDKPLTYNYQSPDITIPTPFKEGYDFIEYKEGNEIKHNSFGDRTFTAVWRPKEFAIKYNLNGGINHNYNIDKYNYETSRIIEDPTRTGYVFAGWQEGASIPIKSMGDKTFSANWNIITYHITYIVDVDTINNNITTYTYESDNIILKNPTKVGYEFIGWKSLRSTLLLKDVVIEKGSVGDRRYEAVFSLKKYNITYNLEATGRTDIIAKNSNLNPSNFTIYDSFTLKNPTRIGYKFIAWNEIPSNIIEKGTSKDIILTAQWELINYNINYLDTNGFIKQPENPTTYNVESEVVKLIPKVKTGYIFVEFIENDTKDTITEINPITAKDVTLLPVLKLQEYKITYKNAQVAQLNYPISYNIESSNIAIGEVIKPNSRFLGWSTNESTEIIPTYFIAKGSTGDIVLTANYVEQVYYISFNKNKPLKSIADVKGEMQIQNAKFDVSINLTKNTFSLEGYTFNGWSFIDSNKLERQLYDQESVVNLIKINEETVNLKAIWTPINYAINYNTNNGVITEENYPTTYNIEKALQLPTPVRLGFSFVGWSIGTVNFTVINEGLTGDLNLTAVYSQNNQQVILDANGGSGGNNFDIQYAAALPTNISKPVRVGYSFLGYFLGNKLYFDEYMTPQSRWDQYESKILLAKWQENSYTIVFDSNKPINSSQTVQNSKMNSITQKYTDLVALPKATFVLPGYTFLGWSRTSIIDNPIEFNDEESINKLSSFANASITLYAKWRANNYIIKFKPSMPVDEANIVSGSIEPIAINFDKNISLPNTIFSLEGYKILQDIWYYNGKEYAAGGNYKNLTNVDGAEIVFYAKFVPIKVNVEFIFKLNNVNQEPKNTYEVEYNTKGILDDNRYNELINKVEDGKYVYKLVDADNNEVNRSVEHFRKTTNTTYYLILNEIEYFINFDSNKPTNSSNDPAGIFLTTKLNYSQKYTIEKNIFTLKGWTLTGYSLNKTSTSPEYINFDTQKVERLTTVNNDTKTIYAIWRPNTVSISLNYGNNYESKKTAILSYDSIFDPLALFGSATTYENVGYAFSGFFTSKNGMGDKHIDKYMQNSSKVKYWTKDVITIELYAFYLQFTYIYNDSNKTMEITGMIDNVVIDTTKDLIIPEIIENIQVSSINSNAFSSVLTKLNPLKSIVLPKTIINIKDSAFSGVSSFIDFGYNPSINSISSNAFKGYKGKRIIIPTNVTKIENFAFSNNSYLEELTVPSKVLSIGVGILFNSKAIKTLTVPLLGEYIPNTASYIGYYFGSNTDSESYNIPNSLRSLQISEGVEIISNLKNLTLENLTKIILPSSLIEIKPYTFENTSNIIDFTNTKKLITIESNTFYNYLGTTLILPSSIIHIKSNAFLINNITELVIPANVERIDNDAITSTSITSIIFESHNKISHLSKNLINGGNFANFELPRSLRSFDGPIFKNTIISTLILNEVNTISQIGDNTVINSIILRKTPNHIDTGAFSGITGVSSFQLGTAHETPGILGYIRYKMHESAASDKPLVVYEYTKDNKPIKLIYAADSDPFVGEIQVPDTVEIIVESAAINRNTLNLKFSATSKLKNVDKNALKNINSLTINFPDSLTYFANGATSKVVNIPNLSINKVININTLPEDENILFLLNPTFSNDKYKYENGFIYSPDYSVLYSYDGSQIDITIDNRVKLILSNAISYHKNPQLKSVTLNEGLLKIMDNAILLDTVIENYMLVFPSTLLYVGESFMKIENGIIKKLTLNNKLYDASIKAFSEITIETLDIGENSNFANQSWGEIIAESKIKSINVSATHKDLKTLNSNHVLTNKNGEIIIAVARPNLTNQTLNIPQETKTVNKSAFKNTTWIKKLIFEGNNLVSIDDYAFMNSTINIFENLKNQNLLKSLGTGSFYNLTLTDEFELPENINFISSSAFSNVLGIKTFKVPDKVVKLYDRVFANTEIERFVFGEQSMLRFIAGEAFLGSKFKFINLPDTLQGIYAGAFKDATMVRSIILPKNLQYIAENAFMNNTSLIALVDRTNDLTMKNQEFNKLLKIYINENKLAAYQNSLVFEKFQERLTTYKFLVVYKDINLILSNTQPNDYLGFDVVTSEGVLNLPSNLNFKDSSYLGGTTWTNSETSIQYRDNTVFVDKDLELFIALTA